VVHRGGFTQKELYEVFRSCDLLKDVEIGSAWKMTMDEIKTYKNSTNHHFHHQGNGDFIEWIIASAIRKPHTEISEDV